MIMGAIAFYASFSGAGGGVANATHLGGLLVALPVSEERPHEPARRAEVPVSAGGRSTATRKKFDVYSGGRADDWDRRIH